MVRSAALIVLTVALLAGCGHKEESPTTVAEAARSGAQVKVVASDLQVMATLPKRDSDADYVSEVAVLVKRSAQAIQAHAADLPPDAKTVTFLALRPDLDRLGNEDAHSFIMATYNVDDLKAAHLDKLGAYGVLDLATDVRPVLPWQLAVGDWCTTHDRAPNFCLKTHLALGDGVPWNGPPGT